MNGLPDSASNPLIRI